MNSISSGIDILEIRRFREINPKIRDRFLKRVFTSHELTESGEKDITLAGKFAAKEAAAKAFGCGIGEVGWQDLEVLADEHGKPQLLLHGQAERIANKKGWKSWSLSISHSAEYAVASVVVLICLKEDA